MDESVLLAAIVILGAVIALALGVMSSNKRKAIWSQIGAHFGLTMVPSGFLSGPEMSGEVQGADVRIEEHTESDGDTSHTYTRFWVRRPFIPVDIGFSKDGIGSGFLKLFGAQDREISDDRFDREVVVRGESTTLLALLDEVTRDDLRRFITMHGHRAEVKDGEVYVQINGRIRHAANAIGLITQMLALAERLELRSDEVAGRLEANAMHDTLAPVCFENLSALTQFDRARARALSQRLVNESPHPTMRLRAGVLLGREGVPGLLKLIWSGELSPSGTVEALDVSGRFWTEEGVPAAVHAAVTAGGSALRTKALELYVAHAPSEGIAAVEAHPETVTRLETEGEKIQLAALYGHAEPTLAEARLLPLLEDEETPVRIAVVKSLGRVATIHAVEPILPLTKGLFASGELKDAAKDAIEAIQSRATSGGQGQLSLSQPGEGEGALSLDEEQGKLSLEQRGP